MAYKAYKTVNRLACKQLTGQCYNVPALSPSRPREGDSGNNYSKYFIIATFLLFGLSLVECDKSKNIESPVNNTHF